MHSAAVLLVWAGGVVSGGRVRVLYWVVLASRLCWLVSYRHVVVHSKVKTELASAVNRDSTRLNLQLQCIRSGVFSVL